MFKYQNAYANNYKLYFQAVNEQLSEGIRNCSLLGYYTVNRGNFLQMFRNNPSVPSSGFKNPKESLLPQYGVYVGKSVGRENSQ